ncbi:MAG TPA: hypothetical protein VHQ46_01095 [Desulfobacteria bacterium]|nr:hypothetical protein [Desulfobacteria bacterium]
MNMNRFEVLIKSMSDGVRFDLYHRPVLIDNIRLVPPDFEEFIDRLRRTPFGLKVDYAGYLEPDPARKPKPNAGLKITHGRVIESMDGIQFDLNIGGVPVKGLFVDKNHFAKVIEALQAEERN